MREVVEILRLSHLLIISKASRTSAYDEGHPNAEWTNCTSSRLAIVAESQSKTLHQLMLKEPCTSTCTFDRVWEDRDNRAQAIPFCCSSIERTYRCLWKDKEGHREQD